MRVCRKCNQRVEGVGRICRACGGILEDVPEVQPLAEVGQVVDACMPRTAGTGSTVHDEFPGEEEPSSEQELARPDWTCPTCGETVPGNFDLCWKCLSAEEGEPEPERAQLLTEEAENEQETDSDDAMFEAETGQAETEQAVDAEAVCPRCGSTKLICDVTVADQDEDSYKQPAIVVFENPEALFLKNRLTGEIRADICGVCGHIEFRVANPGPLYRHYQQARGLDLPGVTKGVYASPCVRCGMLVPTGSSCPHCGASQAD